MDQSIPTDHRSYFGSHKGPTRRRVNVRSGAGTRHHVSPWRLLRHVVVLIATLVALMLSTAVSRADAQLEISRQARVILWFTLSEQAVTDLLPTGWLSAPVASGPAQGANLAVILVGSKVVVFPLAGPAGPAVLLAMPTTNTLVRQPEMLIIGGYVADPTEAPGFYGNQVAAAIDRDGNEAAHETWRVLGDDGGALTLDLQWVDATPVPAQTNQVLRSATDLHRTHLRHGHEAHLVVFSLNQDTAASTVVFEAGGGIFQHAFDGEEILTAVIHIPWSYYRDLLFEPTRREAFVRQGSR